MSKSFVELTEGVTIDVPANGGMLRAGQNALYAPEILMLSPNGAGFGPLVLETPGHVTLDGLTFLPSEREGSGLFAVAGATAIASDKESYEELQSEDLDGNEVDRRGVLTFFGALAAASALTPLVSAQDEEETVSLQIAKFDIADIDAPLAISVIDRVDDVLPSTTEMLIDQSNSRVGEIVNAGDTIHIQKEGTVYVYLRDSRSVLLQILSWANSWFRGDEALTYRREFPNGMMASDFDDGQFISLTEHPAIVETVSDSGPDSTVFVIGETEIPHADDASNDEVGSWSVFNQSLVYEVGTNPPASTEWRVTTRLSRFDKLVR